MAIETPPLARRKKALGVLVETTSGTLNAPTSALALELYDAKMKPDGLFADGPRQPQGHYFGTTDRPKDVQKAKLTFRWAAAHADALMTLIQGCSWTVNSGGLVATPSSSIAAMSTLSMRLWEDGRAKTMFGSSGTLEITGTNGKRVFGTGEFSGVWGGAVDAAMPALAPIATVGYRAAGAVFTIGGAAVPLISQFTIKLGAQVEERQTIVEDAAVHSFIVTDRNPMISIDPEARLVAGHDAYGLLLAGTTAAFSLALEDPAGNSLTIAAPRVQRIDIDDAERDGKLTDPVELECHVSSGNDELTFTKAAAA